MALRYEGMVLGGGLPAFLLNIAAAKRDRPPRRGEECSNECKQLRTGAALLGDEAAALLDDTGLERFEEHLLAELFRKHEHGLAEGVHLLATALLLRTHHAKRLQLWWRLKTLPSRNQASLLGQTLQLRLALHIAAGEGSAESQLTYNWHGLVQRIALTHHFCCLALLSLVLAVGVELRQETDEAWLDAGIEFDAEYRARGWLALNGHLESVSDVLGQRLQAEAAQRGEQVLGAIEQEQATGSSSSMASSKSRGQTQKLR